MQKFALGGAQASQPVGRQGILPGRCVMQSSAESSKQEEELVTRLRDGLSIIDASRQAQLSLVLTQV